MGAGATSVAIVADDPLARAGLAGLIGEAAVSVDEAGVDVVVWDLGPDPALARAAISRAAALSVPVVALVPEGLAPRTALVGNIRALLPRPPSPAELAAAIAAVRGSLVALAPAIAAALVATLSKGAVTRHEPMDALTAREQDVLAGLAEGYSNRRIAQRLGIREATVKFHVNAIFAKLDADSRTDAVVRAARRGLVMI